VHRVPLPLPADGLRAVNVYVIEDGDGLVLVDGGWALAQAREALSAALATIGCGLADIRRFLVTHVHRDHYTQAVVLRQEFGSRVSLGLGEQPAIAAILSGRLRPLGAQLDELHASGAGELARQLARLSGERHHDRAGWEAPDDWLATGQQVALGTRTLRVLATPGHTQGHVVFTDDAAGLLFAGDHVLPHITPSIGFEPVPARLPLRDYLDSLRLVRALPDLRLLPAHGPVAGGTHARIDELLAHHAQRLGECARAVAAGEGTAFGVAGALRWTRRGRRLAELDPFNQMLAITETRAHLELLAAQGRLTAAVSGGVTCYQAPGAPG
jgi:glyoxylase-like metal-dependent hydrolase (beta-lactamase superfamily II)